MAKEEQAPLDISFETHPSKYRHWKLAVNGDVARLAMAVQPDGGLRPDYELKLNSYDLGVDIELCDAIQRLRFEHPEVRVVVLESALDRVFCAGANIHMLGSSSHAFKVNFCKYTNETRLSIEDASQRSEQTYICAVAGPCAGGGYELALACDEILLVDDGNSAVSLPEVPLLGVLPGTGGLTRLVDKRKVRRDLADVFCTTSEGVRGKRAVEWGLVDATAPRSKFDELLQARIAARLATKATRKKGPGITLPALNPVQDGAVRRYEYVTLSVNNEKRTAEIVVHGPRNAAPKDAAALSAEGAETWSLKAFRELDDAILRLRVLHLDIGVVTLRTQGDRALVLAHDTVLASLENDWFAREILGQQTRVLRRLDLTSKSLFAFIDTGSAAAGVLLEASLACDRLYMLADDDESVKLELGVANRGSHPMTHGVSRLATRFARTPEQVEKVLAIGHAVLGPEAEKLGLVTFAPDEIDWDDDVRIAVEERASLSPDALTGMEASLRFVGADTGDSKIFSRLSAWQNWIFQRPNAVGPTGALTKYGEPDRPQFSWVRC